MTHPTLPTLALATLAAAASAQTVPVKSRAGAPEQFSVGIGYAKSNDAFGGAASDGSATTIDIRASVTGNVFLTAGYSDINVSGSAANPSAWAIGLGTKLPAGNGNVELSYAYRSLDMAPTKYSQHWLRVGYNLDLGNGLSVGLAAVEVLNEAALSKDVTAGEVTLGYAFGKGFSANVGYATEDLVYGEKAGKGTTSIGLRYGF